jgi:hypothetical protein
MLAPRWVRPQYSLYHKFYILHTIYDQGYSCYKLSISIIALYIASLYVVITTRSALFKLSFSVLVNINYTRHWFQQDNDLGSLVRVSNFLTNSEEATAAQAFRVHYFILGYVLDKLGSIPGRCSGRDFFLPTTTSRPVMGPTHSPSQWVLGAYFLGDKLPGA